MPIRGRPRLEEAKRRLPRIRLVLTEREVAVIDHEDLDTTAAVLKLTHYHIFRILDCSGAPCPDTRCRGATISNCTTIQIRLDFCALI